MEKRIRSLVSLVTFLVIINQPCFSYERNTNCLVQKKILIVRQVVSDPDEQNDFEQLVNVLLSKACITKVSILSLDPAASVQHFEDFNAFHSSPADLVHNTKKWPEDVNKFVEGHIERLRNEDYNSENAVFIIAIRRTINFYGALVETFVRNFGRKVKLICLYPAMLSWRLSNLVPFHRIVITWHNIVVGQNSYNMIANLALNPDYNRYKVAEYFAPDVELTESCFNNKHNNANTTTTTTTVVYVWLVNPIDYFPLPLPEITPLLQLLIFLRRKLHNVGSRLEIIMNRRDKLKIAFEKLGFLCHTERVPQSFGTILYRDLFEELIPKYNELEEDNDTKWEEKMWLKKKTKKLYLNINRYGTPRSILQRFSHQMVSVKYNLESNDFNGAGYQIVVHPQYLVSEETLEVLINHFNEKACALTH